MTTYSFDLIPPEYRENQTRRLIIKRFLAAFAGLLLLAGAGLAYLHHSSSSLTTMLEQLKQQQQVSVQQQKTLTQLNQQLAELQRREALLLGLRSGVEVPGVMTAVELSIPKGSVWLKQWHFIRSGIVTESQPDPRPPSYFVRMEEPEPLDKWQALTHMSMHGQATDHQALSSFTRSLLQQTGVSDVTVQRTSSTNSMAPDQTREQGYIDFEVKVLVKTEVTT